MSSNRNIAKNAAFLYIRMFLIMGVTLYTSRIILNALGVSDYGLYTIVAGIVAMFGFINGAMTSSTQRYLSFDIGKKDDEQLKKTFSTSLIIHFIIGVLVLLVGETLGLWYINYKLVYPEDRTFAVNVVFHFSLLTLFFNIIQVPYNSLILARERMNIYAVVSILEAALKLLIAFVILHYGDDKLILYGGLTFIVSIIVRSVYQGYCRMNFTESKFKFIYDRKYFRELLFFSSWNMFGSLSLVAKNQGVNIVLNLFFGTVVNAAYGLAIQVQSAVTQFVTSFQSALNPPIVKGYASNNRNRSLHLVFLGARFSFFAVMVLSFPIIIYPELILHVWLGKIVPEYAESFLQLSLLSLIIDSLSGPFMTGIQATGRIRIYQIVVGSLNLCIPILTFFLFKMGYPPTVAYIVLIVFSLLSFILRAIVLKRFYEFSMRIFITDVIIPVGLVSLTATIVGQVLPKFIDVVDMVTLLVWSTVFGLSQIPVIFYTGLNRAQRNSILTVLNTKLKF